MIQETYYSPDGLLMWQDNYHRAPIFVLDKAGLEAHRQNPSTDSVMYFLAMMAHEIMDLRRQLALV